MKIQWLKSGPTLLILTLLLGLNANAADNPEAVRSSPEDGQKIFDWDKHQGESTVDHPFAEKGLIRITRDQTYIYKTDEAKATKAVSVHFGMYDPTNLRNPDADTAATFKSNYDQGSTPTATFDYEWSTWSTALGKFAFKVGSGLFVAQGHGHFVKTPPGAGVTTPREIFTFVMFPNSIAFTYRAKRWDHQLLVPYGEVGGVAYTFSEIRDDNKGPKFGGSLGAYAAGGVGLNMTYFDSFSRAELNSEYGISGCYITLEYRRYLALTQRFDLSSDFLNAGFLMEY